MHDNTERDEYNESKGKVYEPNEGNQNYTGNQSSRLRRKSNTHNKEHKIIHTK